MKKIISLAILLFFNAHFLTAQIVDVKKLYVPFDENTYVANYELSNGEYRAFLNDLKLQKQSNLVVKYEPDSTQWAKLVESYHEPFSKLYHWHPSFKNYPAVNITKKGMEAYCAWLTEAYNLDSKKEFGKVRFRLPTEEEWLKFSAALPGHRLPWYGNFPYKMNKKDEIVYLANIKIKDYTKGGFNYVLDGGLTCLRKGQYAANKLGVYDIIGNVAEYTSDDKVKGGSWDNSLEECYIDQSQSYTLPDPRVGVRLVMEVLEE